MFRFSMRKGAATAATVLCLALTTGFLALHTGCATNGNDYTKPAPNISMFTTGTLVSGVFTPTPAGNPLSITAGGSALFRANFAVKDGTGVVSPGNLQVESNVPFTITNITATTTYNLMVTAGSGQQTNATVQVVVLAPPTALAYSAPTATYYKDVRITANASTVSGGGNYTYTVSPTLPAGLALDPATGTISGTPQAITAGATYTVTAKDAVNQSTTATVSITVVDTPLAFSLSPNAIAPGGSSILGWDASLAAGVFSGVTITALPTDASLPTTFGISGTANVTPAVTTNYTLSATPTTGGPSVTRTIGLTVGDAPVSLTAFDASPEQTVFGGTSALSWAHTGVPLILTLDGADVLNLAGQTVIPVRRHTYVLSGSNLLNVIPSTLTKSVAARGLDNYLGSPLAGGWLDGTGSAAKFAFNSAAIAGTTVGSMNLSMDPSGNLLVADALNHVVRLVTPAGVVTTLAGKPGVAFINVATDGTGSGNGSAARFNRPAQLIYVDANTMYAIDYGTHSLRLLTKQGDGTWTVSVAAGTVGNYGNAITQNLDNPLAIAYYNAKIYIADGYTSSIRVYDPAAAVGSRVTTLAGSGTGQQWGLLDATGIAARMRTCSSIQIDPANGDIYVADRENHAIRKVTQAGVVTTLAGAYPTATAGNVDGSGTTARFSRPTGLARAADGTLFVTDNNNHTIRKLVYNAGSSAWDVTTIAGTGAPGNVEGAGTAAAFYGPEGITLDPAGNLYVADAGNFQIRKLTLAAGTYTSAPFAGARQSGLVNSPGLAARFAAPNGVAVDKNDVIYVADEANKVIRKIATDGTVTTWGTGVTLTAPYTLTVDDNLNIYVLDRLAAGIAVVKINAAGTMTPVTLTGATFVNANPRGIAVTKDGLSLFLADGNNLRKFDLTTLAQTNTIITGLIGVNGIATAADGVYWVEYSSHTVKKAALDLTAPVIVAGTTSTRGFVDGDRLATARFYQPAYLTLVKDASGNATKLYVVDQGNHALRQVELGVGGQVSTLVGHIDTSVATGLPGVLAAIPGTLSTTGTSGLYFPKGVGVNSLGDLFVSTSDGIMQVTAP